MSEKHEIKTGAALATKVLDERQGIVEHLITVFGVLDDGGDISHAGSFAKTLTERGNKVRVVDSHNYDSVMRVVGKPIEIREIPRAQLPATVLSSFPDATGAVWAKTQFLMDTPEGRGVFERIKAGAINEWSYGYDTITTEYEKRDDGKTIRHLKEIRLWEYSPVLWGMNPATTTMTAKAAKLLSSARKPDYVGTESTEWSAPSLEQCIAGYAKFSDEERPEDGAAVGDLSDAAKNWITSKSLLGDPGAETFSELLFFPVVNPITNNLNENALRAVISGRGAQADISDEAKQSAQSQARQLLEDEFEMGEEDEEKDAQPEAEQKAGRVIAARNEARLVSALGILFEIMEDAGIDTGYVREDEAEEEDSEEMSKDARSEPDAEDEQPEEIKSNDAQNDDAEGAGPNGDSPTHEDASVLLHLIEIEQELLQLEV